MTPEKLKSILVMYRLMLGPGDRLEAVSQPLENRGLNTGRFNSKKENK